jgi:hypothetical protein
MRIARLSRAKITLGMRFCMSTRRGPHRPETHDFVADRLDDAAAVPAAFANALSMAETRRRASTSPRVSNSLVLPLTSANRIVKDWLSDIAGES